MTTKIEIANISQAALTTLAGSGTGGPKVTAVSVTNSSYVVLDDTAVDIAGGYIKITGSGFATGCQVLVNNIPATSTTYVSSTEVRAQVPATAAGTYILYVVNTDGGVAIRINGITFSSTPTWATSSTLTSGIDGVAISITLSADGATSYSLQAGSSLPSGLNLSSGGLLSGTVSGITSETTYSFTVVATDGELQDSPRTFSITISAGDPDFSYVTMLLGNTTPFTADASSNNLPITIAGDTKPVKFTPYTPGYYSNYFDGSGDYLSSPSTAALALGTGDFTLECWIHINAPSDSPIYEGRSTGGSTAGFTLTAFSSSVIRVFCGSALISSSGTDYINRWTHVALSRLSGTSTLYINGTPVGSTTSLGNITDTQALIGGGRYSGDGTVTNSFPGYISNFRIVKGTALYTTNFIPSTVPLTAVTNTTLLTCQSNRLIDNSTGNLVLTPSGNVAVSGFDPFPANSSYSTLGSAYFDGTGDYLTVGASSALVANNGFTIEAWVYYDSISNFTFVVSSTTGANNYNPYWFIGTSNTGNWRISWGDAVAVDTGVAVRLKSWNHVAIVMGSNGTGTFYVNGVSTATTTSKTLNGSSTGVAIGDGGGQLAGQYLVTGYISDVRYNVGNTVYTAAFTPPTSPLAVLGSTSLLTLRNSESIANNLFLDSSSNNYTLSRTGNVNPGTRSPYGNNWSMYFDGNGDSLSVAAPALPTGSSQYTIEFWINTSSATKQTPVMWGTATNNQMNGINILANGSVQNWWYANDLTTTGINVIDGKWHHIAAQFNGTSRKIYVDGVERASDNPTGKNTVGTSLYISSQNNVGSEYNYVLGNLSNVRISNTAVYTGAFTPTKYPFTTTANTVLLTCQSNRVRDASINNYAITCVGDAKISRLSPFSGVLVTPKTHSVYFDGTGDYLSATGSNLALGTGDFTIECWLYRIQNGRTDAIYTAGRSPSAAGGFGIKIGTDNKLAWNTNTSYATGTGTISAGQWHHIAITRQSGTLKWYINGVLDYTLAGFTQNCTNGTALIGITDDPVYTNMYISNFRIVTGTPVYTANFTPPTQELTAISGTQLLTCQNNMVTDISANNYVVTGFGNAQASQQNPFGYNTNGSEGYTANSLGGSAYFDGNGDYLNLSNSSAYNLASSWTIELWAYPMVYGTSLLDCRPDNTNGYYLNVGFLNSTTVNLYYNAVDRNITVPASSLPLNSWHHIAVVKNAGNLYTYLNGALISTIADTNSWIVGAGRPRLAANGGYLAAAPSYYTGYIGDVRITNGTAVYTCGFVPQSTPLTAIRNTTLLLNMTSGTIHDKSMNNNIETVGDSRTSTAISKFGGTSTYLDGSDYLQVPAQEGLNFGTSDFTIECWVYNTPISTNYPSFISSVTGWSAGASGHRFDNTGYANKFWFGLNGSGGIAAGDPFMVSTNTFSHDTWYHYAITRSGNTWRMFVNGNLENTQTFTGSYNVGLGGMRLGYSTWDGAQGWWSGYLDDVRITKGVARYTSSFTPPTSTLTAK